MCAAGVVKLLSALPDNALHIIFDYLSSIPGRTGVGSRDAFALASVCAHINHFYRKEYVDSLELSSGMWAERTDANLSRALCRLPKVSVVVLDRTALTRHPHIPRALISEVPSLVEEPTSRIKSLSVRNASWKEHPHRRWTAWMGEVNVDLQQLAQACPRLEDLELTACSLGDEVHSIPVKLRRLSLRGVKVTASAALRIIELEHLAALSILECRGIARNFFSGLETLGTTLTSLFLHKSNIDNEAACALFRRLVALRSLGIVSCTSLTEEVLRFLPASLKHIDVSDTTDILGVGNDDNRFVATPDLDSLVMTGCRVEHWAFLAPLTGNLTRLVSQGTAVPEIEVSTYLSQLLLLETLDLSESRRLGDMMARAAAHLPRLKVLSLRACNVFNTGLQYIATGPARLSLLQVDIRLTPGSVDSNKRRCGLAVERLRRSLSPTATLLM
jgi:hypothetical protein